MSFIKNKTTPVMFAYTIPLLTYNVTLPISSDLIEALKLRVAVIKALKQNGTKSNTK